VDLPSTVAGVEQRPLEGMSFASTFGAASAPETHRTQYYEMFGCRALYHDGWKAVVYHDIQLPDPGLDVVGWELYDLRADPAECHDLAAEHPDRLQAMIDLWWAEAERYQVLPLDNRPFSSFVMERVRSLPPRSSYTYWPGRAAVPEGIAVDIRNRAHEIAATVTVGDGGVADVSGVLAAHGTVLGGWSFHLLDGGRLCYAHNLSGWRVYRVEASVTDVLTPGNHVLAVRVAPPRAELLVDGVMVGDGLVKRTAAGRLSLTGHGLTAGWAFDFSPAEPDYRGRFPFTGGVLHRVDVTVDGVPVIDAEAEARDAIAMQ
jgi:arylsulfatase